MNTAIGRSAPTRHPIDRHDAIDYLLCGLTALCGAAGYWILYPNVFSQIF